MIRRPPKSSDPAPPPSRASLRVEPAGAAARTEAWADLTARVRDMSAPSGAFFLLVTLSTTIAAYGLLSNSTAVVIGAMLVAPLMGPIFGIALGLATGDAALLARAAGAELQGMALSVGLALVIGMVPNHPAFGAEILARTHPTVYDMIVAVASGLAGAFALADARVSPALPGVAIATAIVPPLATTGLCLATGRADLAGGAFLLFLANLLAIEAVAAAYFTWVGVRWGNLHERVHLPEFVAHFGISIALLGLVGAFLTHTLLAGIQRDRRREAVRHTLDDALRRTQGARLSDVTLDPQGDSLGVFAVVMTPQAVAPDEVAGMERALRRAVQMPVHLVVRSLIASDADRSGPVYVPEPEEAPPSATDARTRALEVAGRTLRARLAAMPGVELQELRRERLAVPPPSSTAPAPAAAAPAVAAAGSDTSTTTTAAPEAGDTLTPTPLPRDTVDVLMAVVRTPEAITSAQVDSLQTALGIALGAPVRLLVRSIVTRDATASGSPYGRPAADSTAAAARGARAGRDSSPPRPHGPAVRGSTGGGR